MSENGIIVHTRPLENIETIETKSTIDRVFGLSSAKSERDWINAQIRRCIKANNHEMLRILEGFAKVHNHFYPESKIDVDLESWKRKSGVNIIVYPEYFDCIEWRKPDEFSEPKELHHKLYKNSFNQVYKAFQTIKLNQRYKTPEFAEIWARINHIWENADGNKIIDNNGFNYANVSGCRRTYFDFYYAIKVLEKHYKVIKYEKSGHLTKIRENLE